MGLNSCTWLCVNGSIKVLNGEKLLHSFYCNSLNLLKNTSFQGEEKRTEIFTDALWCSHTHIATKPPRDVWEDLYSIVPLSTTPVVAIYLISIFVSKQPQGDRPLFPLGFLFCGSSGTMMTPSILASLLKTCSLILRKVLCGLHKLKIFSSWEKFI